MGTPVQAIPQEKLEKLESKKPPELQLSESTKRILDVHELKSWAKKEPAEAIIALDKLRADGQEPDEEIAIAIAEVAISDAHKQNPEVRAGLLLRAAVETYSASLELAKDGGPRTISEKGPLTALGLHDRAIEGLIDALQEADSTALAGSTVALQGPQTEYRLQWVNQTDTWTPATHIYIAASSFERKKKDVEGFLSGLGAPIVAVRKGDLPDEPVFEGAVFTIYKFYYPLTAVLEISPPESGSARGMTLKLVDPRQKETYALDGIVPYWSSHLDGAASEKIVPSGHGSYKDPEGIKELIRILHVHLDSVKGSS